MKRFFYLFGITFLLMYVTITCNKDNSVTDITLNKTTLTLNVGETETLIATVKPESAKNKAVTWASSNVIVATVMPNGLITALSKGTTTIVVTTVDGGFSATCQVQVNEISVSSVNLNKTKLILDIDETETLIATVLPQNATNKEVWWSIDNPIIATVYNGLVTPTRIGKATITVNTLDGNKTTKCELEVVINSQLEHETIFVRGGIFTMGCTNEQDSDCYVIEKPDHQVRLSSYYIGKYEVTQAQWFVVMKSWPDTAPSSTYGKGDNYPMYEVSWNDIVGTSGASMVIDGITYYENGFIYKLNKKTDKQYRLPTEAEWEYAARGGANSNHYKYSGSNNIEEVAWYYQLPYSTKPVGTKRNNELGIYDMSGNVMEWCSDWAGIYSSDYQYDPTGPSSGSSRIIRGGCWRTEAIFCRVSFRTDSYPEDRVNCLGFRLALSL